MKWVDRHLFLVKWKGLGYADCSWETTSNVGDEEAIKDFRNRDIGKPTEPNLLNRNIASAINEHPFVAPPALKFNESISQFHDQLQAQLYAQVRALQFSKSADLIPPKVSVQAGCISLTSLSLKNPEGE